MCECDEDVGGEDDVEIVIGDVMLRCCGCLCGCGDGCGDWD